MMSILYHSIDHALTDATAQVIVVCLMCIIMKYMDSGSLEHQEHQEHQEHREHREHREYQEQKSLLFQMFNYYQQGWLVGLFCQFIIHQCKLMTIRNLQGGGNGGGGFGGGRFGGGGRYGGGRYGRSNDVNDNGRIEVSYRDGDTSNPRTVDSESIIENSEKSITQKTKNNLINDFENLIITYNGNSNKIISNLYIDNHNLKKNYK